MLALLPQRLQKAISSYEDLREIRLRVNRPIRVNVGGKQYYLTEKGISHYEKDALLIRGEEIAEIVARAADYSLYAKNDDVANGFLILSNGVRLGLCGEAVRDRTGVKTFKHFSSLCVRYPHEIKGCARMLASVLSTTKNKSCLIVSPPGGGKTTILRDLARALSQENHVLVVDERYEIASCFCGKPHFDIGNCDVISGCGKSKAFENGIRSMAPELIVTDEIGSSDLPAMQFAMSCGVGIIASIHAEDVADLLSKPNFSEIREAQLFERYFVLGNRSNPGQCKSIYDEECKKIWERSV